MVGAGIVGLACARAAALRGLKVIVIDRDAQANGASIRNFGFITVTGQERGLAWQRARKSSAIWQEVAQRAGIPILQRGLWMTVRRPEAVPVLEAFLQTEMSEGCELLSPAAARARCAVLANPDVRAVLTSTSDIRVDSREAIPRLAAWLAEKLGVLFLRNTTVLSVAPPLLETSRGGVRAAAAVVCPGDDLAGLFPQQIAHYRVTRCKLQMLKLAALKFRLPSVVMSEFGLLRYAGYSALPEAAALRARLEAECGPYIKHGVHLIAAQGADGTLIVGDSHHYAPTPDPFADEQVDRLILEEFAAAIGKPPAVLERWTGTYASCPGRMMLMDAPAPAVRLVLITSGTGASTGFAIGEEAIEDLLDGSAS